MADWETAGVLWRGKALSAMNRDELGEALVHAVWLLEASRKSSEQLWTTMAEYRNARRRMESDDLAAPLVGEQKPR